MQGLLTAIWLFLTLGLQIFQPAVPPAPLSVYEVYRRTQSHEFDRLIVAAAETWRIDPFLFKGLLWIESGIGLRLINPKSGAAGIPQFTKSGRQGVTNIRKARGLNEPLTYEDCLVPEKALPAAAELLSYLVSRWGRDYGLASYNGGKDKHNFALRVLRQANRYRTESGLPPLPAPRKKKPPLPTS